MGLPRNAAQRRFLWVIRLSTAVKVVALLGAVFLILFLLGVR